MPAPSSEDLLRQRWAGPGELLCVSAAAPEHKRRIILPEEITAGMDRRLYAARAGEMLLDGLLEVRCLEGQWQVLVLGPRNAVPAANQPARYVDEGSAHEFSISM